MPTTAISEVTSPPPRHVRDEFKRKFETYGRSTPLVITPVEQICGEEDYDIHKRLLMVTAESVAVGSDDGRVTYYARLSEVDSIIVKDDLILLRGCPRIGTTVDLLIKSNDSDLILSTLEYYKHHSFRLPLPVLQGDDSLKLQTVSWLCDGIDVVDVLLWEIPRREDRLLEVRPQSPKEAKELLVLHQLRRDLNKASELGLRGEPQPPLAAFAPLADSLRKSPGSVNICAMHESLIHSFENIEAIFIRVVHQLTKSGKKIDSVIAVCREAALLCDFEGNIKRMLRYVQLQEIATSDHDECAVVKLIPHDDEGEQVMTLSLIDDERNCHPQANSLLNAFERAILDAGLSIPIASLDDNGIVLSPPPHAASRTTSDTDNTTVEYEEQQSNIDEEINDTPDFIKKYASKVSPEIFKNARLTTFEPSPVKSELAGEIPVEELNEEESVVEIITTDSDMAPLPPPIFRGISGIPPFVSGSGDATTPQVRSEISFSSPRRREILDWLVTSALPYTESELRTFSAAVIDCGTPEVLKVTKYLMQTVRTMADKERESNKQEVQKVGILQSKVTSLEAMMKEATAKESDFEITCEGLEMQISARNAEITKYEIDTLNLSSKCRQLEETIRSLEQKEDQTAQLELLNEKIFEMRSRADSDDHLRSEIQLLQEANSKLTTKVESQAQELEKQEKELVASKSQIVTKVQKEDDNQSDRSTVTIPVVSTPRSSSSYISLGLDSIATTTTAASVASEPTTPREKPAKNPSTPDSLSLCKVSSILARLSERTKSISDGYAKPLSSLDDLSDSAKVKRRNSVSSIGSSSYTSTFSNKNKTIDSNIPPFAAPSITSTVESTTTTTTPTPLPSSSLVMSRTKPTSVKTFGEGSAAALDVVETFDEQPKPEASESSKKVFGLGESQLQSEGGTSESSRDSAPLKSFSDMLEEAKMKAKTRLDRDPEGTDVTMRTMLERARNREQRAENEVADGGAPQFSGSPEMSNVQPTWRSSYEDNPSLCSALKDYVTTVSLSPDNISDGAVTASPPPPPNHAPIISSASISRVESSDRLTHQSVSVTTTDSNDTTVDQFTTELLDAGLRDDEQLAVKRLGVRNRYVNNVNDRE